MTWDLILSLALSCFLGAGAFGGACYYQCHLDTASLFRFCGKVHWVRLLSCLSDFNLQLLTLCGEALFWLFPDMRHLPYIYQVLTPDCFFPAVWHLLAIAKRDVYVCRTLSVRGMCISFDLGSLYLEFWYVRGIALSTPMIYDLSAYRTTNYWIQVIFTQRQH